MNPTLKAPESKLSNIRRDKLLSSFAFHFDLRRYIKETGVPFAFFHRKAGGGY
jgi:hypothetical protein